MRSAAYLSGFIAGFLSLSSATQAQDANPKSPARCDAFRTAVLLELCKDSVTVSMSRSSDRETFRSVINTLFVQQGDWQRRTHNSERLGFEWTPTEDLRIGFSGARYAGNGTNERIWAPPSNFVDRDKFSIHHSASINAKFRLLSGAALGGEHRVFALGEVALDSGYRATRYSLVAVPPFFNFTTVSLCNNQQTSQGSLGLQSAHNWKLDRWGIDLVAHNTAMFTRVERGAHYAYTFETRLLAARSETGIALGPVARVERPTNSDTRIRPYVSTGLAGYVDPSRLLNLPGLRGLVLDGSATWLAVQKIDRNFFPATFDARPTRHRTELSTRARYTFEY